MTRKRHKELTEAVATLRRNLKEVKPYKGMTGKHYQIDFKKGVVGIRVGGKFYNTLCWVEEYLWKAKEWGMVK